MSKKVKKSNATEEVNASLVTETLQPTDTMVSADQKEAVAPEKTEEAKEVKETKETKAVKKAAKPSKKTTEKKATEKKASEKKVAKEAAKSAPVEQIFVQYAGNEYATSMILANVKDAWVAAGHKVSSIKSLNVYIKPEENAAYYVINNKETGKIDL